jgi:hypothetical protein
MAFEPRNTRGPQKRLAPDKCARKNCGTIGLPASCQTTKRARKLPFRLQLRQITWQNMGATVEAGDSAFRRFLKNEPRSSVSS